MSLQGRSQFRVCRFPANAQKQPLTEGCLNKYILRQASGPQKGWNWWYHRDASDQTTTLKLPGKLDCDNEKFKCVLQYRYQAGALGGIGCLVARVRYSIYR